MSWIESQFKKLDDRGWFAGSRRREALANLAQEAATGKLELLVGLAERCSRPEVRKLLEELDGEVLARAWYASRHPALAMGRVARSPAGAKVVTELKAGVYRPSPETARALLTATEDAEVSSRARAALTGALDPRTELALCAAVLKTHVGSGTRALAPVRARPDLARRSGGLLALDR